MSKRRQERMAVEMKKVLSQIIKDNIKDPRLDFSAISITRVDVTSDLSHAKVNFSVLGDEGQQDETMKVLQKARGYLRSELAKEIQLRHAPELEFRLDRSIEHGIRISSLLEELREGESHKGEQ
ncbi:MAG TPA: 30S ribosome-binding factor RbfA [Syntrophomonadaceae bacterium]|nr:30S ribosome-binding factor RbfA [Syntrophomonadaceae bacterium]HNX28505.1 30S ribosome-binding factor RbfA [Syntrophomonadaceae bacterium]HPR93061.1 30S ribosome-binding factor RbfA [Syntrophomonadaceae bacterium]